MKAFKLRLDLAILQGAALALAGCSARELAPRDSPLTTDTGGEPAQPDAQSTAGTGGEPMRADSPPVGGTSGGTPAQPDRPALPPYASEDVACTGMDYGDEGFGFHGQCCAAAACYTPEDGVCATGSGAPSALGLFFGSGRCLCGEVKGPFAPNPDHVPTSAGRCCYLIPSIGCDGRAFLVDGQSLVSAPLGRHDWLASELLGMLST